MIASYVPKYAILWEIRRKGALMSEADETNVKEGNLEVTLLCVICGHDHFWQRKVQLHTAVATFLDFEWLNERAACRICARCGYIHWFRQLPNVKILTADSQELDESGEAQDLGAPEDHMDAGTENAKFVPPEALGLVPRPRKF